jgi:HNH endonuclease
MLRLLSLLLPNEFPFQSNWKFDACHFAFWELFPTIDHVVPVSRGGSDREDNLVTTSMMLNAAKANFTLEQLGWTLHHDVNRWDGLTSWFMRQTALEP